MAWVCGGDRPEGKKAIEDLVRTPLGLADAGGFYGNGMDIALVYDLLGNHPDWTTETRQRVNILLEQSLQSALRVLDGKSASLWHGRFQLACAAWVVASILDNIEGEKRQLLARAQSHFLDAIDAVLISGGWPEGYSYWINNRAFPFAVACMAHMNAVEATSLNRKIEGALLNAGLWTIHGTEPAGRFCLFGDTGPRTDLKDETQRFMDIVTLATGLPIFRDYSRYLFGLHGEAGYYSGYRWGIPLFRGLPEWDYNRDDALKDLSIFDGRLKTSALFGRDGMGQAFIRSDWGPDATFISYQAGHSFTHHGHYQAGHFTITKKTPLAITSGTYGGYTSAHRLHYYLRTTSGNSLLVLLPGEKVKPNQFFENNVADGGQRIVMPTGSAVDSVKDWEANLYRGRHYEGGRITAFDQSNPAFVYIGSDLTGAYNNTEFDDNGNGGKVKTITRQLVYLTEEDLLIVYDKVVATDEAYTKKWLLHSWSKPATKREHVLAGSINDGILESDDNRIIIKNGEGVLEVLRVLPRDGVIRKVGGPNYRYYVEKDGDDSDFDGANMVEGANEKPWFDAGLWRIEIQPAGKRKNDQFLVVLKASINGKRKDPLNAELIGGDGFDGLLTERSVVVFGRDGSLGGEISYIIDKPSERRHILVGTPRDREVRLVVGGKEKKLKTTEEGVLSFKTTGVQERKIVVYFGPRIHTDSQGQSGKGT